MNNRVKSPPITRRSFLKAGCLGAAALGVTVCGAGLVATAPGEEPIELPSEFYGDKEMTQRVLVAYASSNGSTGEVAAEIGKTLAGRGLAADVRPIQENPQLDGYQAVLLGSAVQYGTWLPAAVEFVKANQGALSGLPVALFSVHIRNLGDDEASRKERLAYLDAVRPFVHPAVEVFFAGRFDRRGAAMLMPGLLARFMPTMDHLDRGKIRLWAENLPV